MATTLPVIKGRMGSIDYYMTTMKAGEAVRLVRLPNELPDWGEMTIEERTQRELEWERVEKEISQFIALDPDRFYNALLVGIYHSEGISFEVLSDALKKLKDVPDVYSHSIQSFGFLHMTGAEVMFVLDGQHRLKGTDVAMSGKGRKGQKIPNFEPNLEVSKDDIAVILIPYEPGQRARKIFNKINKYAKSTSKGDNIITSEDDAYAILARRLIGGSGYDPLIPENLVNWTSNTLSARSTQFTTISVLYESGQKLLGKVDTQFRPDDEKLDELFEELSQVWQCLIEKFSLFNKALNGLLRIPDLRAEYLCFKPAGQLALITAIAEARNRSLHIPEIVDRLNSVNWKLDNPQWQGVIMQGKRIQSGKGAINFAGRFIAYLIGAQFDETDRNRLLSDFNKGVESNPEIDSNGRTLPEPFF